MPAQTDAPMAAANATMPAKRTFSFEVIIYTIMCSSTVQNTFLIWSPDWMPVVTDFTI